MATVIPFSQHRFTASDLETFGAIFARVSALVGWSSWEREQFPDCDLLRVIGVDGMMAVSVQRDRSGTYAAYGDDGRTLLEGDTLADALGPWGEAVSVG